MSIHYSRRTFLKGLALSTLITVGLGYASVGNTEQAHDYTLATATVGGTYYPVGVALSTLIKVKLLQPHGINLMAVSSAGSTDNIRLLRENQAQFAILAALIGHYARTGQGPFAADKPYTGLRAVTALWREPEQFVVKEEYATTGTIEDMSNLKGKKVSLGLENSGTIELNRVLLSNLGIDIKEMDLVYLGYDASAEALLQGQIEAMSTSGGMPVSAVTLALGGLGNDLVILEFTYEQLEKVNTDVKLWSHYLIPAGTYPSQDKEINTAATTSFLAVRADVEADVVYQITKTIYENLSFLQTIHQAARDTRLENALTGLPVPLHPGALRYYQEVGLKVPAKLIAE